MPNNEEQTRIMDKIAKLLALAQSSNPNEAAIALSRAQKLMEEHKVTQRDVSFSSMGEKTEAIPTILRDRQLYTRLGHMIARAFGVANIYNFKNERITSITLLGDLARVESATYAFTVLARQAAIAKKEFLAKLKKELLEDIYNDFPSMRLAEVDLKTVWANVPNIKAAHQRYMRQQVKSYLHGWLIAVDEKVMDFALSDEEMQLIEDFKVAQYPHLSTMRSRAARYTAAQMATFQQGMRDGKDNVSLFHGVNTNYERKALGHH